MPEFSSKQNDRYMDREAMVRTALEMIGLPYRWGGDDPGDGFDCSGMVVECLKTIGKMKSKEDTTANGLFLKYEKSVVAHPKRGDLLFWINGKGKAIHVAICENERYCITADGGGSKTLTEQDAIDQNAFIKRRRISHRKQYPRIVDIFRNTEDK